MARYLSPEAKKQRARRRKARKMATLAFLTAFVLILSYLIVIVIESFNKVETESNDLLNSNSTGEQTQQTTWDYTIGPVEKTINNFEIQAVDYRMVQLPENGSVDLSYFSNAVFVGDSLTEGLRIYPNIENAIANIATFVSNKNLTPKSYLEGEIVFDNNYRPQQNGVEAIVEANPGKVYITLGANALTFMTDEQLMYYYRQLIETLQQRLLPNAIIYVCSITPTTAEYAAQRPIFSSERLYQINNQIAKMCTETGVNFVNLHEALAGDDGYLPLEYAASDGLHLQPSAYSLWVQYLMTHTVHRPDNPYMPGSPYYVG